MSILIKGREMPENCQECVCLNDEYFFCQAVNRKPKDQNIFEERPDWCPLIEIPPHGRLIDADALRLSHCVECTLHPDKCLKDECDWGSIYHIDHATTIIPADKDGEK